MRLQPAFEMRDAKAKYSVQKLITSGSVCRVVAMEHTGQGYYDSGVCWGACMDVGRT